VKKGGRKQLQPSDNPGGSTDHGGLTANKGKCGNKSQVGYVKFFCKTMTGDLGTEGNENPLSGWHINASYGTGDCIFAPGWLPSTDKEPTWWANFAEQGPAQRSISLYFSCCCNNDFVEAQADPS